MSQTLSDKTKALILVLGIVTFSILIAWFTSGWQLSALIAAVQIAVVYIARHVWMTDKSDFILRGLVLGIISGVVLLGNAVWQPFIAQALKQAFPNLPVPDYSVSPTMLLFLLILATIVFRYTNAKVPLEKPERKIADLIEGPTIQQKWARICENLSINIRDIDTNTNWDDNYYTPLDAEVEMKTSNRTQKVVKDLLTAIKDSNDRLFLLVGDPGAGKSVAVRKLCLDILKTSVKDEYIPIYVNLKEWTDTKDWTKTPPTWQDLEAFVKRSLLQKNRFLADFFEKYYNVLDENGNLFFILDSFDEIPQVLGTTADAQLIQDLSIVCREFLQGAKQKRSKGILASRDYRMPRQEYLNATTKLTVRPFTFEKIEQTLTQSGQISKATVEQLLRERPELVPSMRNPFITSLLKEYLAANKHQFPKNQADLFENYIRTSINKAQANRGLAIPYADVMQVTIQIAKLIFSEAGLQAPLSMLREKIKHPQFDSIVEIMRYTRIARGDANNTAEFSFAHRRFYEYFVVQDLLNAGKSDLPLKSIPTDSRWRDTLVLYCEVAPFEDAQRIANYCWFDVILPNNDIRNRASKHCLRFLTEAFRGRQECLVDFHEALGEYVLKQIYKDNDPIDMKLAVEALGILSVENLDKGAIMALNLRDAWINDIVIRSCRHLAVISNEFKTTLLNTLLKISVDLNGEEKINLRIVPAKLKFNMSYDELLISFRLSDVFKEFIPIIELSRIKTKYSKLINILIMPIYYFIFKFIYRQNDFNDISLPLISIFAIIVSHVIIYNQIDKLIGYWFLKDNKYYKEIDNSLDISFNRIKNIFFAIIILFVSITAILLGLSKLFTTKTIISFLNKGSFFLGSLLSYTVIVLFILACLILVFRFYGYIKYRNLYLAISKSHGNNREKISEIFKKLYHTSFINDFIDDIESNVKQVHGTFPEGFLRVGQSGKMTRLIKLQERWREAEEREAEAEQTKRQTAPRISAAKTAKDFVGEGKLAAALLQDLAQPQLSKEAENRLVLFQSRLSTLAADKHNGVLESTAYEAKYNTLVRDYLNSSEESY